MPELPEVETIKLGLQRKIIGLKIKKVDVLNSKTFQGDVKEIEGKEVVGVWRRAKILGIDIKDDKTSAISLQISDLPAGRQDKKKNLKADDCVLTTLLFHLKMTGQLIFVGKTDRDRIVGGHPTSDMGNQMPNSSTRVIFEFDDGSKLYFNDQRKFGWVKVTRSVILSKAKDLVNLGPEPLDKEFTRQVLKISLLRRKNMPIKVALMDQSLIAGIGNIYASESLYLARIDPKRKVLSLSDKEFKKLHQGIKDSLEFAIEKGGSTRSHYVNVEGERGRFLDYATVYGREGELCKTCNGKIIKTIQAGRGTYFCPKCQK